MKVFVDSGCNVLYASFYLQGLYEVYGKHNVVFCSHPFRGLRYRLHTHIFAFVVEGRKFCIDFADSNQVFFTEFLEWADVYGKVNYKQEYIPVPYASKVAHCGCNYALCIEPNRYKASFLALLHYANAYPRIEFPFQSFLSRYIMQAKRHTDGGAGTVCNTDRKYIFFVSTLWKDQEECNRWRIAFIRACLRLQAEGLIRFEGGLIPDATQDVAGIEDIVLPEMMDYSRYRQNIQRSAIAFNTPAYFGCHGWKLPEYFAMGKVVLSTPFINDLPEALTHGKNIFFAGTELDRQTEASVVTLYEAVRLLVTDTALYDAIAQGAQAYYETYMSPKACVNLLINKNR